ncbi:MAG TPA: endopeptidase La [Ktedonobacterales bacterium]|nr:endopeptidase La [Ktedonobacterales bacterium]
MFDDAPERDDREHFADPSSPANPSDLGALGGPSGSGEPGDPAAPSSPADESPPRDAPAEPTTEAPDGPPEPEAEREEPEPEPVVVPAAHAEPAARTSDGESEEEERLELPAELPILPLKDTVVYPFAVTPLGVGRERSVRLIDEAMRGPRLVGLVAQKDAEVDEAGPDDCFRVGTVARIARLLRVPDGVRIIVQGLERIEIEQWTAEEPFLKARCRVLPEAAAEGDIEVEALKRTAIDLFQRLVNLVQYLPDQLALTAMNLDDARQVVYLIASTVQMDLALRQELLELDSVREKLEKVVTFLGRELELLELGKKIQNQAQEEMGKAQREYFLREQLKAIQKELGEESDDIATVNQLREQIEAAGMPEEALTEARRELSRLEKISSASPEFSIIRTYLDTLVSLPWNKSTGKPIDVPFARQVLDEDHYDLDKIKDRIVEYLAVRRLKELRQGTETGGPGTDVPTTREPILCFVGPPGVGKTSLGHSIARALGRQFVRLSLGGIHDEAEIRGHRRTYIGALPGRIIASLRRAGSNDPVFMLDEVDKVGADWRGDPSSALLEVLDPEQNHAFRDNYLDLPFDLSKVMFIATANALDPIPAPLRDRMEVLELTGYTEEQKVHIARRFLFPKQLAANGLRADEVNLSDEAISTIVNDYTREAGVRNLERELGTVLRKLAKRLSEGQSGPIAVTPAMVRELLGRQRFFAEAAERIDRPGVVTGMVWTPVGGDIIFIEAAMMRSREPQLTLTGQLGDVMKESAMTALTYVRSNSGSLGIDPRLFEDNSVHIHVPAGAIPKDGPSAGVTIMTAIVSLARGLRARSDVAMTGEISLRGKVLPIGGLKEKVLAAHRAGIMTVIFPERNAPDLDELPEDLRNEMTFIAVDDARDVLTNALEGGPSFRTLRPAPQPETERRHEGSGGMVATPGA